MTRFLCAEKADKKFCKTRGEEQSKEVDSRQQQPAVSRLKCKEGRTLQADYRFQAVSRLSRLNKEEDKAEFKVHSDLARRPNKNQ